MELGSRDVEELLCARLGIAPTKVIALRGRLDHLRKMGCPTGVKSGRGRPAVFGWTQIIQLALAMDLINLGVMPEHAASAIKSQSETLGLAVLRVVQLSETSDSFVQVVEREKWPLAKTVFLIAHVGALSALQDQKANHTVSLGLHEGGDMLSWLEDASPFDAANIIINLGSTVGQLVQMVSTWAGAETASVANDLIEWAEHHVHS